MILSELPDILLSQSVIREDGSLVLDPATVEMVKAIQAVLQSQSQLKRIDLNARAFVANGKTYLIETSPLSIDRYTHYEKIETEVGFGRGFTEVFDMVRSAMNDIIKHRQGDAYVKLYNVINGVQQLQNKKQPVYRFCALFMNTENEDRRFITEDLINQKIEDWRLEGLAYDPFFNFAVASMPDFIERYKKLTQSISVTENEPVNEE